MSSSSPLRKLEGFFTALGQVPFLLRAVPSRGDAGPACASDEPLLGPRLFAQILWWDRLCLHTAMLFTEDVLTFPKLFVKCWEEVNQGDLKEL